MHKKGSDWEVIVIETVLFLKDRTKEECDYIAELANEKAELMRCREAGHVQVV